MMRVFVLVILQIILFGTGYIIKSYYDETIPRILLIILILAYTNMLSINLRKIAFIQKFIINDKTKDSKNSQLVFVATMLFEIIFTLYSVEKIQEFQLEKNHQTITASFTNKTISDGDHKCTYTYIVNKEKYKKFIFLDIDEDIPQTIEITYYPPNPNISRIL